MTEHFIIFDTETTGVGSQDSPVQIAVALVDSQTLALKDHFVSLIKPNVAIHPSAQAVHGITDSMVENAPTLQQVFDDKLTDWFATSSIWCGHNVSFDLRMCESVLPERAKILDTLSLARLLYPKWQNHKLTSVVKNLDLPNRQAHDALGDVLSCLDFLQAITDGKTAEQLLDLEKTGWIGKRVQIQSMALSFLQQKELGMNTNEVVGS